MNDQSQDSKLNYYLVRKAFNRVGKKYKLTGIAPFIISYHIDEILCSPGNIIDLAEERYESLETYREDLDVSTIGEISRAFSVLERKEIFIQWKVKRLLHRRLHPEFIRELKNTAEKILAPQLSSKNKRDIKILAHELSIESKTKASDRMLLAPELSIVSSPANSQLAPELIASKIEELTELTDPRELAGINSRAKYQPIGERVISLCKRMEKKFDMGKKPFQFWEGNALWMEQKIIDLDDSTMSRFVEWLEGQNRFWKFSPEHRDKLFNDWSMIDAFQPTKAEQASAWPSHWGVGKAHQNSNLEL